MARQVWDVPTEQEVFVDDPESSNSESEQRDDKPRRESWWSFCLDLILGFGDVVGWMIGGVVRVVAWVTAAVLSPCN